MKRHIVAIALALVAAPALALEIGAPYDQSQIDRQLPNIDFPAVQPYVADERAPYDQLAVDRALPNLSVDRTRFAEAASVGSTRSDVEISVSDAAANVSNGSGLATGPWANDYHFIAPAQ
jgi:hypothetical protein